MVSALELAAIAVGMGMDVFSVSMAVAAGPRTPRQAFRLSFHFGLFQFLMPVVGWTVGRSIVEFVHAFDHWVAFGLLAAIGAHMLYEGLKPAGERAEFDRSRGWSLVALAVATSLDALGVGLTFGVLRTKIVWPAVVIGLTSSFMSLAAVWLGRRLRSRIGQRMEIVGGLILIGIGIRFLIRG